MRVILCAKCACMRACVCVCVCVVYVCACVLCMFVRVCMCVCVAFSRWRAARPTWSISQQCSSQKALCIFIVSVSGPARVSGFSLLSPHSRFSQQ